MTLEPDSCLGAPASNPRRRDVGKGRLDDPDTEAAADDARDLAYRIARGEGHLFRASVLKITCSMPAIRSC